MSEDNDGNNETVRRTRVTEDFPERVVKARTKLFPFLKSCMDNEVNIYLRYDSLVVDGQSYIYDYVLKRPEHCFGYVWISNTIGDANQFIDIFTKRIKDISIQNWRS